MAAIVIGLAQGAGFVSIVGGNVSVALDGCALSDFATVRAGYSRGTHRVLSWLRAVRLADGAPLRPVRIDCAVRAIGFA